ncbi:hypothetical protein BT69DRAFT_1353591 [Atractiella rhizophila]|nr:hypothetical protein BT69DRAFT_1354112 [Atractiella rhizophila]KAH8918843.1 hypothetical protein BT69DRAFT_1353591 [Atractiella rhizophila]
MPLELPDYKDLPHLPDHPEYPGCAWGLFGKDDELGTVNLLTDDVVKEAAQEIKKGRAVSLNWAFHLPLAPSFHREGLTHKFIINYPGMAVRDDHLTINSQAGTQWGLRHFGVLATGVFYNGLKEDAIKVGEFKAHTASSADDTKLGIHNLAKHGVNGRGVLLDLPRYFASLNPPREPIKPLTSTAIPVKDLEDCAKWAGVTFRRGDILLIRVGFIKAYGELDDNVKANPLKEEFAGIEQSEEMKAFLWNNHFAALASDQPSLERWPPPEGQKYLHETILGLWGCPIGEMFDLEELSKVCSEEKRWSFFFTSWPLNVVGGIASPPNAGAFF